MFERFTDDARRVVSAAQVEARRLNHPRIGTEHLLLAMLQDPESLAARVLTGLDHGGAEARLRDILNQPGGRRGHELDAELLSTIGIDLDAIREKVEEAFGPGALDREPVRDHRGLLRSGRHIPFGPRAKKTLELSLREAIALKHKAITDGHVLLGVIREGGGLAMQIITEAGISPTRVREALVQELSSPAR
ncbi:Clp protease N-terminal domain-containing protein [Herbidospora yilanensis]|uniref:Clp protease N-terminal domain-containing protein n=1 Tax=Herbidospora yilanensis TaxID=354426 RepID=UPI000782F960|nr:Clp protease N-terminal domain-containing protein [Herbidospora yilanensis]